MITAQKIVDLLNELTAADPGRFGAMHQLCEHRVPACPAITDHQTVPVSLERVGAPFQIGMLGVLNGIAALEGKVIMAHYDEQYVLGCAEPVLDLHHFSLRDAVPVNTGDQDGSSTTVEGPDGGQLLPQAPGTEGGGPA